jgi:hypothetical protein
MSTENDVIAGLLIDIQNRITEKVPAIKYTDEDWGQLDFYAPNMPVQFPCALVDVPQITWSNVAHNGQLGAALVKVKFAQIKLTNTSGKAPTGQKQAAFATFFTLKDINQALNGWTGNDHYSQLIRVSTVRQKRNDGIRLYEVTYSTTCKDYESIPVVPTLKVKPRA